MADACRERDPSEGAANTPTGAAPGVLDGVTGLTAQDGQRPIQAELWEPRTSSVRLEVVPTFPTPAYTIVTEPAALTQLLPQLQAAPRLGVDTETTGLDPLTDRLMSQLLGVGTPERNLGQSGLGAVVQRYLGLQLPKELQHSRWDGHLTPTQLEYAVRDAAVLLPLADRLRNALRVASLERTARLENDCVRVLAWFELTRLPVEAEGWVARAQHEAVRVRLLEAQLHDLVGSEAGQSSFVETPRINWQSRAQVRALLHARGHQLTATDSKTLSMLADPLVPALLEYRDAVKRVGAYGREWIDAYRHPRAGRLHANYFQLGAWSGRMSCGNSNVQTIPRSADYRSLIRVEAGHALIKADWSQIELRLAAVLARDAEMLKALRVGHDLHTVTTARVLGVPAPQVTKHHRQIAKALNFGLLCGMRASGLRGYAASQYHVILTPGEAAQHRQRFFQTYPSLQHWYRQTAAHLEREGRVETRTLAGRRQRAVKHFTIALNSPVQGSGADGLKLALARLYHHREEAPEARLIAVVHDEVVAEVPAAIAEHTAAWLTWHVTAAVQELVSEAVPIVVETTIGQDWAGSPL